MIPGTESKGGMGEEDTRKEGIEGRCMEGWNALKEWMEERFTEGRLARRMEKERDRGR